MGNVWKKSLLKAIFAGTGLLMLEAILDICGGGIFQNGSISEFGFASVILFFTITVFGAINWK